MAYSDVVFESINNQFKEIVTRINDLNKLSSEANAHSITINSYEESIHKIKVRFNQLYGDFALMKVNTNSISELYDVVDNYYNQLETYVNAMKKEKEQVSEITNEKVEEVEPETKNSSDIQKTNSDLDNHEKSITKEETESIDLKSELDKLKKRYEEYKEIPKKYPGVELSSYKSLMETYEKLLPVFEEQLNSNILKPEAITHLKGSMDAFDKSLNIKINNYKPEESKKITAEDVKELNQKIINGIRSGMEKRKEEEKKESIPESNIIPFKTEEPDIEEDIIVTEEAAMTSEPVKKRTTKFRKFLAKVVPTPLLLGVAAIKDFKAKRTKSSSGIEVPEEDDIFEDNEVKEETKQEDRLYKNIDKYDYELHEMERKKEFESLSKKEKLDKLKELKNSIETKKELEERINPKLAKSFGHVDLIYLSILLMLLIFIVGIMIS